MHRIAALILVATACGGGDRATRGAATAPAAVAGAPASAPKPGPRCVAAARRISAIDDAFVTAGADGDEQRTAALAALCARDAWPVDILACVDDATEVVEAELCLEHLVPRARDALAELRHGWAPDDLATLLAGASDPLVGSPDAVAGAASPADVPECTSVLVEPAWFPPAVAIAAPDRSWTSALRGVALVAACASWSGAERQCFARASDAAAVAACLHDAPDATAIAAATATADALVVKLAGARAHPAAITCERVVDAHYRDAAWHGKLDRLPPDERRTLIAGSRTAMAKACTADSWSADLRACLVADGGDVCFAAAGAPGAMWGYPAIGVFAPTGIAACDAYAREATGLIACAKLSASAKQNLARTIQQTLERLAAQHASGGAINADECESGRDAIREMESNLDCTP